MVDDNQAYLAKRLPPWMPTEADDGNTKLIGPVADRFDHLDAEITSVDEGTTIQHANSIGELQEMARIVDELPKQGETVDEYRMRIIAAFQKITCEGTLGDIFGNISTLLDIEPESITYEDLQANGEILLGVPGNAMDTVDLSQSKFAEVVTSQSAAGYRIDVKSRGTFTYITPTVYNNNNHDASKGYDGLDSNGDPKDTGGTYAGILS